MSNPNNNNLSGMNLGSSKEASTPSNPAPSSSINFEVYGKKFLETTNLQERLTLVTEIRDNIELVHTIEYKNFLQYLFPAFFNQLRSVQPQFNDGPEQKIRNIILEILNRLPSNELLRPTVQNLLKLSMYLLEIENEENAIICLRIIIDLHKNYRPNLEEGVQPFLDIVQKIYSELPNTVANTFRESNKPPVNSTPTQPGSQLLTETPKNGTSIRSIQSFKVLTECPIIVVLLFQLYPRHLPQNIPKFMPLIIKALNLNAPRNARTTHRAAYVDFIAAQVKTLSFLAYMLRSFQEHLKPYQDTIPKCVIQLLNNCPNESAAIRKELLIATRHILATDFRAGFISQIDALLDEKILIGSGRTAYESLRPLAYSTLADLVHHVRNDLTLLQVGKVVYLYSRNVHDSSLPFSIQTMSAKLLLNLVEVIARKNETDGKGRILLMKILDAFVNKFSSLKKQIPKLLSPKESTKGHKTVDNIKDCRVLMKTLVLGLKNIVWGISSCTPNAYRNSMIPTNKTASLEESMVYTSLLKNGLQCFSIYSSGPNPSPTEEKDILDHFAAVFTMVDVKIFQDVFSSKVAYLFDSIKKNQSILTVPQHFLANPVVSRIFADILLNFLIDRMQNLSSPDKNSSSVLLRLFKLVFGSVTLFADNEPVLQPYLATIITSALKYATETKDPINYFFLLRALFRSIGGGKFDLFFKEFLPLLPSLLESLNKLHSTTFSQQMKDLFIELALTVPVRLSALLPCLPLVMKPLVLSLESNQDLVIQGLRTLELCVENFEPNFFDSMLSEVKNELLLALWKHLKPPPYLHGSTVLRILGKLAGRNRQFLIQPPKLKSYLNSSTETGFNAQFILIDSNTPITFYLDKTISLIKQRLQTSFDLEIKKSAFLVLKYCLNSYLKSKPQPGQNLTISEPLDSKELYKIKKKLENEDVAFKLLLDGLLIANSIEELKEMVNQYLETICQYFALYFCLPVQSSGIPVFRSEIFVDALVDAINSEDRKNFKVALKAIDIIIDVSNRLSGSLDILAKSEFGNIGKKLCHSCYQHEWSFKHGACYGISYLCNKMPKHWIALHQVNFIQGLLFILKELSPEVSMTLIQIASENIFQILQICNSEASLENSTVFSDLVLLFAKELSSFNFIVRNTSQKALQVLSNYSKKTISEILEPFKIEIFSPILNRHLRSLPILVQTGYIDAVTFCLNLRSSLIPFSPDLLRLLQGALNIAERDDIAVKTIMPKNLQLLTNLRTVSIELLSAAMNCQEFQGIEQQEFRNRIIGVFFKALTVRSKEIVNVAKKGLEQVIAQQKLVKDLLQSSLRPVLLNLADYKKLSVPLLEGLARLLELLTNCFNVTLGEKLLEHLNKWVDPTKSSTKIWKEGEEVKIAAAIIDIFHFLPPQASKFLESLIPLTVQLESFLPRDSNSPYRLPLIRYLNKYPTHAIEWFLCHISQVHFSRFFRFLIHEDIAGPLREELAKNPQKLVTLFTTHPLNSEIQFQCILIIRSLVKFMPYWLGESRNRCIIDTLVDYWNSPERMNKLNNPDENSPLYYSRESKILIKCFLNYCMNNRNEVDLLFYILSIFNVKTTIDYNTFLKDFYLNEIAEKYTSQEKQNIFLRFLQFFRDPNFTQEHKVRALRILIIPLLSSSFSKYEGPQILDQRIIGSIIFEIFDPRPGDVYEEALNIELLQFATLLVKYMSVELVDHRKELIKFAWSHLRSEDTTTRQCAYVLVCRFIEAYDTPPKIILQVYIALLRAFQPEARNLVKQALDILLQALQKRLPTGSDAKFPTWVKWTKKIIIEEGHSLPQIIHILQLIVRHPQLFYQSRSQFVPYIINSLSRIALSPNSPQENRKLGFDLAELIISWEKQRLNQEQSLLSTEDNSHVTSASGPETPMDLETSEKDSSKLAKTPNGPAIPKSVLEGEFKINSNMADILVNFLVHLEGRSLLASITEGSSLDQTSNLSGGTSAPSPGSNASSVSTSILPAPSSTPNPSTLELLQKALQIWPDVQIKFAYFEKLLTANEQPPSVAAGALEMLNIIFDFQLQKFVTENLSAFQTSLSLCFTSSNQKIISSLCLLLQKLIKCFPLNQPNSPVESFYSMVKDMMETNLNNFEKSNIHGMVQILKTLCDEKQEYVDQFISPLVKAMQKLSKEHISPSTRENKEDPSNAPRVPLGTSSTKKIMKDTGIVLLLIINLLSSRLQYLGENRSSFFSVLISLIEKSMDIDLLLELLKIIGVWVKEEKRLTFKEITQFLSKMTRFEQLNLGGNLHTLFLELVYHIYNDSSFPKTELVQLENGFMMGLRCRDTNLRNKFFELFNRSIDNHIFNRLTHIFSTQNWEHASSFWIRHALDLLLALVNGSDQPLKIDTISNHEETMEISSSHELIIQITNQFSNEANSTLISNLLGSLRELFQQDSELAYHLWVQLFPLIWSQLSSEDQSHLIKTIKCFLGKEYHSKQQRLISGQHNVIQALLEGISRCQPLPNLPKELIKYLGKTFNCWHVAIYLLEHSSSSMFEFSGDSQENFLPGSIEICLSELYQSLSEEDLYFGLLKMRASVEETKCALLLEQHGQWQKSQDLYFSTMNKAQSGTYRSISSEEVWIWEEHWINCAKRLNQWEILNELFARKYSNSEALLDSAWKVSDWNGMREAFSKFHGTETAQVKLWQGYLAIHEGRIQDVEGIYTQAIQLALKQFQLFPEIPSCSHIPSLQSFQQIVELKESAQILKELNSNSKHQQLIEIKQSLHIWRERHPNWWEDILVWNELLTWRQHVFSLINTIIAAIPEISNNPTLVYTGYHEIAWTINKFSHIARKHELVEVCSNMLSKIYNLPNIEIQDAFVKLREQIKCYFQFPTHYRTGLDVINSLNLEFFSNIQKAEFFQLKGEFLRRLNQISEASTYFSTSVSLYENLEKGWLSWAQFSDQIFSQTNGIEHAEYAIICYLQAIRCGSNCARRYIPRILWLISFDDDHQRLVRIFEKYSVNLPPWIWIQWIPQLLASLSRPEGSVLKEILINLANVYTQPLFYYIRSITTIDLSSSNLPNSNINDETPIAFIDKPLEIIVNAMKTANYSLISDLENILTEFTSRLQPEPEELLLVELKNILLECHSKPMILSISQQFPPQLKSLIETLHNSIFVPKDKKYTLFIEKYKSVFESDFSNIDSSNFIIVLKTWIDKLNQVVSHFPKTFYLEDTSVNIKSPYLAEFHNSQIEIPGQYLEDTEPSPDFHIRIEKLHPEVKIIDFQRCISFRGNNGKLYPFLFQTSSILGLPHNTRTEEKISKLFRIFKKFILKHKETRRRNLYLYVPDIIPCGNNFHLVSQSESEILTLNDIYLDYFKQVGQSPMSPLDSYKNQLLNQIESPSSIDIYHEVCDMIPSTIILNYFRSMIPSYLHFFSFKKQFVAQLGLISCINHILGIGKRNPSTIGFTSNGTLIQKNILPEYESNGSIKLNTEPCCNLRLTRNIQQYFGTHFIEGLFNATMTATISSLNNYKEQFHWALTLLLKDDFLTFSPQLEGQIDFTKKLKLISEKNSKGVIQKIVELTPPNQIDPNFPLSTPINQKITELISIAQDPVALSEMDPTYFAWF